MTAMPSDLPSRFPNAAFSFPHPEDTRHIPTQPDEQGLLPGRAIRRLFGRKRSFDSHSPSSSVSSASSVSIQTPKSSFDVPTVTTPEPTSSATRRKALYVRPESPHGPKSPLVSSMLASLGPNHTRSPSPSLMSQPRHADPYPPIASRGQTPVPFYSLSAPRDPDDDDDSASASSTSTSRRPPPRLLPLIPQRGSSLTHPRAGSPTPSTRSTESSMSGRAPQSPPNRGAPDRTRLAAPALALVPPSPVAPTAGFTWPDARSPDSPKSSAPKSKRAQDTKEAAAENVVEISYFDVDAEQWFQIGVEEAAHLLREMRISTSGFWQ